MASITIRDITDDVKAKLVERAKASGESLEGFLRRILSVEAAKAQPAQDSAARFDELMEMAKKIPPPEPGEKDFHEYIEDLRARDKPLSDRS
ncbi:MAG: hypothetical protein AAGC95_10700 [Pseudomonadota bacterium]